MKKQKNQMQKPRARKPKKLKLMPTLREKRHYLVVEVGFDIVNKPSIKPKISKITKNFNEREIEMVREMIDKAILQFIGILNYAKAGPLFIWTVKDKKNNKVYFIISITTKYVDKAKAAITLINKKDFLFRCAGVSGTIKKAKRFFLNKWILIMSRYLNSNYYNLQ